MKFSKLNILKDFERYIKKNIKRKLSFSKALMISFLITGGFSFSAVVWIEYKNDYGDNGGLNQGTGFWHDQDGNSKIEKKNKANENGIKNNEATIITSVQNRTGANTELMNKDFKETVIIGSRAVGGGHGATSIGYRAIVGKNIDNKTLLTNESHQGTAVGYRAFSYGKESTSVGNDTVAYGESSISIGSDNIGKGSGVNSYADKALSYEIWKLFRENSEKFNYTGEYAAIDSTNKSTDNDKYHEYLKLQNKNKTHNWAFGDSSIAIGSRNVAYGHSSLALGTSSVAKGNFSTALGTGVLAFGNSAVAVGNETYVYAGKSVGIGNNVQAIKDGAMVYGLNSYAGGDGSIAIGKNALSNVAPSDLFKDTLEQYGQELYEGESTVLSLQELDKPGTNMPRLRGRTLEQYFTPKTEFQNGTGEKKAIIEKETNQILEKTGGVAIGYYVYARGENTIAIGRQAYAKGDRSIAFGPYAYTKLEKSAALGYGSKALNSESLALGSLSRAEGKKSIAIGINSAVKNSINDSNKLGENSIALGNESIADLNNSIAIGYQSKTDYNIDDLNKVYIPRNSFLLPSDVKVGVVSVGSKERPRRIVNVAAGYKDTDAANISQLRALEDTVILDKAMEDSITPYFGVEQANNNGEAAKISKGIEAEKNYERYIEIAGRYAELLNRKHYGGDNINHKTLEDFKNEVEKLGRESNIKGTATEITKILTELKSLSDRNHKNELTFKSKYEEIQQAVKADNTENKKRQVSSLTEQEINDSNYKGNLATGKDSIAIGYGSKATHEHGVALGYKAKSNSENAVVIGQKSEANARNSIAIGNGAKVENNAGDSIAIGNGSLATAKEEAKKEAKTSKDVKFTFGGGVSSNNDENNKKTVFSIGKNGTERIIKNVAAGVVSENSTDAINGSQLYSVANEFSKLAVDVLGAEAETGNKTGFKKSQFKALKTKSTDADTTAEKTFKAAIDANIDKINSGFTFSDGNISGTRQLGETIEIKAGAIDNDTYSPDNIKTNYYKNTGVFLIGIKKQPTFEKVTLSKEQTYGASGKDAVSDEDLISKHYLDKALENVASSFTVAGDVANSGTEKRFNITDTLNINGESNITTKIDKDNKKVIVTLKDSLTEITSIESKDNGGKKSKLTLSSDHILSTDDIYVGSKDNSNKLVKKSELGGGYITFEDENGTTTDPMKSNGTQNVNFGKKVIYGKTSEITPTVTTSDENAKITFAINDKSIAEGKLDESLKNKIDKITTNTWRIAINAAKIKALSDNKITFKDGSTGVFERTNNSNKNVVFKGEGNLNVALSTGSENNGNTGTFTISVNQTDKINPEAGNDKQGDSSAAKHENKLTTEKAVVDYVENKLNGFTTTETLEDNFLKVTGENIYDNKEVFGSNVGLEEIKLEKEEKEGSSQLIQEKALIEYFKGSGKNSVKLSNSSTTKAYGEGSVSIGHNSVSRNEGSISIGYNSGALNSGSLSIGQDSNVLGMNSIGIGRSNNVAGNFSFVLGEGNTVEEKSAQTYVIGSDNIIKGRENISLGSNNEVEGTGNILLGSRINADDSVNNAVVLGNGSIAVDGAVSVGSFSNKRRITFVADPKQDYDAANKKYVDSKLTQASADSPIETIYKAEDGKEVVKYGDKFYKKEEVNKLPAGAKFDAKTNKFIDNSGNELPTDQQPTPLAEGEAAKKVKEDRLNIKGSAKKIGNVKSGLGLTSTTAIEDAKEKVNKLLGNKITETENVKSNDPILNNVATVIDLQALGQTGIDFVGNDGKTLVHRNLGQTLTIKGAGTTDSNFAGADGNINVKANTTKDALLLELSEELKNLKSAVFEKDGELDANGQPKKVKTTIGGDGIGIKEYDKDGNPIENGKSADYKLDGSKVKDGDKSTETTANGISIKDKDKETGKEKDVLSIKNENGKGKIDFAKDKDGKGTGTISGLADLTEDSDGSSATNKNYVDSKLKELTDNSPIKYENEKGEKVIKGKDGKFYKPEDIKGKKYVKDKGYVTNPKNSNEEVVKNVEDVKAILDPNAKLSGIESGIGLDGKDDKKIAKNFIDNELKEKSNKNAINAKDLHFVSKAIIDKGLTFGADKGEDIKKSLGSTIKVSGGTNINTEIKEGNVFVNLNDKITLSEVKTGNTTLNNEGINIKDNKGNNLNINSNSIKGLADLNENSSGDLAANKNYVDSKAKEIKASSNGAIAGAIAMANLPQVSGNSIANVSAALGYQDKSVALALGVSGTNKKGNVVYKASGSINTQANVSLGAGLGYQFGVNRSKELVDINSIKKVVNKHTLKLRELEAKNKQLEEKNKLLENKLKLSEKNQQQLNKKFEKEINDLKKLFNSKN